ncbi:hypothetical protein IC229_29130 [Spirosoma sp. BT702]|uniref:Plasminogen-binding protein PgbA N-terminal domain-containing protein n=1 Tax=Spirosoma profusum TaxID=2771354 RepID=A0A927AUN4_9BACT|nr:hypothetical protein [Spirosoma profusum]MBD2704734.1 hypothetical protein [Spirosoma profusum]
MKTATSIVAFCLAVIPFFASSQNPEVIRVKGGLANAKAIPLADQYQYSQFREGKILYTSGQVATALCNYNVLVGEMQFINASHDTLALADEMLIRLIGIGEDVYVYHRRYGYLKVTSEHGKYKLAEKQGIKTVKSDKLGGYNQSTGVSSVVNYQFYSTGNGSVRPLETKGDVLLFKEKVYYFIDQNNLPHRAIKAGLLTIFRKNRADVTTYLDKENVDFRREENLKKLLNYCSELP